MCNGRNGDDHFGLEPPDIERIYLAEIRPPKKVDLRSVLPCVVHVDKDSEKFLLRSVVRELEHDVLPSE